ncbi:MULTISPECIES: XrtA/PEP-CTERM system histidine kinase PrsK [unclassified Oleiphilus]|nr:MULTISPECIES: XrtA/PEP-CTERM system histidine kinase PrsK [unclassified Oleiphilus]KZY46081.1 histidine kinase [Oleiphilus sp. HI0050]KZY77023.1 histidine kinase [Oleiphilus sp. HI0069]KZY83994.1 histidine kinase [Oleiphilus sp. HI0068]KZY89504.1 histidine kinase [Oleiphilus sp. HI0072]KZZ22449.1 histidine kinase [Oleiphilus sp. HI0081]
MNISFLTISNSIGLLAFLLLAVFIASKYLRRSVDRSLLLAALASSLWMGALVAQGLGFDVPFYLRYTFELIRNAAWFDVLYALLGISFIPNQQQGRDRFYLSSAILALLAAMVFITLAQGISGSQWVSSYSILLFQVSLSIVALLLLEQVWRSANMYSRSGIKYLTIAIGTLFCYDFFMYSDALLFRELSAPLWETRGAINALAAPFIALTLMNNQKQVIGMHVSRQMAFHSTTLVVAGIYLILISAGGYYISVFGGTWGEALRILFIVIGLITLILLISSPILRARIMVFISKNFFDYKYDYRDEWIKSTRALSDTDTSHPPSLQAIKILGDLVGSQSGAIWIKDEEGLFKPKAQYHLPDAKFGDIDHHSELITFFTQNDWIINLDEYMLDPSKYKLIEIPESMLHLEHPWLILPLGVGENLSGLVLLCEPIATIDLNWENYDLLKIVSQQACSYIVQSDSQEKLGTAMQFEAVNKASAFLVHDIKTIIAQLSLLVKNAEKHKSNPAFVDDMIRTTSHTVEKMDHLLQQIHNPNQNNEEASVELGEILLEIYQSHKKSSPSPSLEALEQPIWIHADKEQLRSAIGHIVQNAIDATDKAGEVSIASKQTSEHIFLFIQDSGIGMSEEFIQNQLFKPFESTKGLTGMGIGVYQSREYLRKLGGTISVTSQIEVGTCFTLKIPLAKG